MQEFISMSISLKSFMNIIRMVHNNKRIKLKLNGLSPIDFRVDRKLHSKSDQDSS